MDRAVSSIAVRELPNFYSNWVGYLANESSVDLRQRAPGGLQSDVSIRGSSFGQTLVLINGLRVNDAQTGHYNMDVPLPLDSIQRIEILRGAGSTFYGSDAVGGALNFITAPPENSEFRVGTAVGNFGTNEQTASAGFVNRRFAEQLSFSRDFSSGFMPDRDYRSLAFSSDSHAKTAWGSTSVLLGYSDRPYGADQFYGEYPSWERTKAWFASLRQELGTQTEFDFGYRRHTDVFDLIRDQPWVYENNHVTDSWQAALRRHDSVSQNGTVAYGIETYRDSIDSSNLGIHARNRGAIYASYDMRALKRFSFTIGGREEAYNSTRSQFSPTVAGGYWLGAGWKLRASASRAFRLPTYTDLYYVDPANVGNSDLRPESAWSYEGGFEWDRGGRVRAGMTLFQRRDHDVIDYAQCADDATALIPCDGKWHALNVEDLRFTGVEASLTLRLPHAQRIDFAYTGLHGSQDALQAVTSRYVFSQLRHNGTVTWQGTFPGNLLVRSRLGVAERYCSPDECAAGLTGSSQGNPYPLWDFAVIRQFGYVSARLAFANLSDTRYEEIQNVLMPGRSVLLGLEFVIPRK